MNQSIIRFSFSVFVLIQSLCVIYGQNQPTQLHSNDLIDQDLARLLQRNADREIIFDVRDDIIVSNRPAARGVGLDPGQNIQIVRTGEVIEQARRDTFYLPERYLLRLEDGTESIHRIKAFPVRNMKWDTNKGKYTGAIGILLEDERRPNQSRELVDPVLVDIIGVDIDKVDPPQISLTKSNSSPVQVRFETKKILNDPVKYRLHSRIKSEYDAFLRIVSVVPVLPAGPIELQGLGVEAKKVNVNIQGKKVTRQDPVDLSFDIRRGTVTSPVEMHSDTTKVIEIRSSGTGSYKLQVSSSNPLVEKVSIEVVYKFPIWFLIAAFFGAFASFILVYLNAKSHGKNTPVSKGGIAFVTGFLIAVGISVGFNSVIGAATGVTIPYINGFNEAVTAFIASIPGLFSLPQLLAVK